MTSCALSYNHRDCPACCTTIIPPHMEGFRRRLRHPSTTTNAKRVIGYFQGLGCAMLVANSFVRSKNYPNRMGITILSSRGRIGGWRYPFRLSAEWERPLVTPCRVGCQTLDSHSWMRASRRWANNGNRDPSEGGDVAGAGRLRSALFEVPFQEHLGDVADANGL
jgi:hypothetical protein